MPLFMALIKLSAESTKAVVEKPQGHKLTVPWGLMRC